MSIDTQNRIDSLMTIAGQILGNLRQYMYINLRAVSNLLGLRELVEECNHLRPLLGEFLGELGEVGSRQLRGSLETTSLRK